MNFFEFHFKERKGRGSRVADLRGEAADKYMAAVEGASVLQGMPSFRCCVTD